MSKRIDLYYLCPPFPKTMRFSALTNTIVARLDSISHNSLMRRDDLTLLIESAAAARQTAVLDELGFHAKFISKTHRIMIRIGKHGEGYDKLSEEFRNATEKAKVLLNDLLAGVPAEDRERLASTYLRMTNESFQNLMALFHDLMWYKNWLLDHGRKG
jgi:hypothetical protein